MMEFPGDHISYSQLNLFEMCAVKWYYKYVKHMKEYRPSRMILGSAVDRGLSHNFMQKIDSHEDLPVSVALEAFSDKFEKEFDNTEDGEVALTPDESVGELKDEGAVLLRTHYESVTPSIQPIACQRMQTAKFAPWDIATGEIYDAIDILAYPDVITDDDIIDFKVVKKTPSSQSESHRWQLAICDLTRPEEEWAVALLYINDYIVRLVTPKVKRLSCLPCYTDNGVVMDYRVIVTNKINQMLNSIRKDVITPNRTHYICRPLKYNEKQEAYSGCGYWKICHEEF